MREATSGRKRPYTARLWYVYPIPCFGGKRDGGTISKSPIRRAREPTHPSISRSRLPVQLDGYSHPAGNAGDRSQRVGPRRFLPQLDGLCVASGGWAVHPAAGPAHWACGSGGCDAHVHRCRIHPLLHNGGGGWKSIDPDRPGAGLRRSPTGYLQVAVHTAAHRNPHRRRHSHNDTLHNAGIGSLPPTGRCLPGGAHGSAIDGTGDPDGGGSPDPAGLGAAPPVGAGRRHNRRHGCFCWVGHIRRKPDLGRALGGSSRFSPRPGAGLWHPLLDPAALLPVSWGHLLHPGNRGSHYPSAGGMAREQSHRLPAGAGDPGGRWSK